MGDILVALAPTNGALGREEVAPPLAWTLRQGALNKRQSPDLGQVDLSRFLEALLIFPCGPLGLSKASRTRSGGGVSGVRAPGLLEGAWPSRPRCAQKPRKRLLLTRNPSGPQGVVPRLQLPLGRL